MHKNKDLAQIVLPIGHATPEAVHPVNQGNRPRLLDL